MALHFENSSDQSDGSEELDLAADREPDDAELSLDDIIEIFSRSP